jgi:hypothetical protein
MSSLDPVSPTPGSLIEILRVGDRQQIGTAMVRAVGEPLLVLDGRRFPSGVDDLTLRWWDDDDNAWEVRASVERWDQAGDEVTLRILDDWRLSVLRAAARVEIDRAPVDLITIGGDGREVRRQRVTCLDLSTTGCRVGGSGAQPARGDVFLVAAETAMVAVRIDAHVVHVVPVAFGGWQAGLEFLPHTPDERGMLVAWRDSAVGP